MIQSRRDIQVGTLVLAIAVVLHWFFRNSLFSYLPAPLVISIITVWVLSRPWRWLVPLLLISELYTSLPLGIMTAVVVLPALIWKVRGKTTVDLSFSFLTLIITSVALQVMLLISPDLVTSAFSNNPVRILNDLPWQHLILTISATTSFSFAACILLLNLFPTQPNHTSPYARIKSY